MTGRAPTITATALQAQISAGLTTAEIAAHFGVQTPAVTRACHRFGMPLPGAARKDEPTRAIDERDLQWLRLSARGVNYTEIARRSGYTHGSTVMKRIRGIEAADLAESGEPARVVAKAYPLNGGVGA